METPEQTIKRLETERDKIDRDFTVYEAQMEEVLRDRDAQLAEMRAALEGAQERLNWYAVRDTQDPTSMEAILRAEKTGRAVALIEEALATDTGKAVHRGD